MPSFIDTHSHVFLEEFDEDRQEVIERCREVGLKRLLLPNIDDESVDRLFRTCDGYPGYCIPMMGLHPTSVDSQWRSRLQKIRDVFSRRQDIIAVGEVGMDLYWDKTYEKEQTESLREQCQWALDMDLPLVLHCRNAFDEIFRVLSDFRHTALRGVFHSFTGEASELDRILGLDGFMVGINGIATYKKSAIPSVLDRIPLDRMLLETDCPYLAPVPKRGRRNESSFLLYTLEFLAQKLGIEVEELADRTTRNAESLFRLQ